MLAGRTSSKDRRRAPSLRRGTPHKAPTLQQRPYSRRSAGSLASPLVPSLERSASGGPVPPHEATRPSFHIWVLSLVYGGLRSRCPRENRLRPVTDNRQWSCQARCFRSEEHTSELQ